MDIPKKGQGSFWISKRAIQALIENRATATQINAYLVLAMHTNAGGKFSTAGIKAIHKATGMSHPVLERVLASLMSIKVKLSSKNTECLIYTPEHWARFKKEEIPPAPFERAKTRFVINDFNSSPSDRVWFSNELVTGYGEFKQPLKRLKMYGDIAVRLLLLIYEYNDMEQYGGINPSYTFYYGYRMEYIDSIGIFDLWHGEKDMQYCQTPFILKLLGLTDRDNDNNKWKNIVKPVWSAIEALEECGFIYEVVSVMDRDSDMQEAQVIYELHTRNRYGFKNKGEEGLGVQTAKISKYNDYPLTDETGRFDGRFAAIVPQGVKPQIIGIYRPRFRISNTKNHGVAEAWSRIQQGQRDAQDWLNTLEKTWW